MLLVRVAFSLKWMCLKRDVEDSMLTRGSGAQRSGLALTGMFETVGSHRVFWFMV